MSPVKLSTGYDPLLITERAEMFEQIADYTANASVPKFDGICVDRAETNRSEQAISFSDDQVHYHVLDATFIKPDGHLAAFAEQNPRDQEVVIDKVRQPLFGDPVLGRNFSFFSPNFKGLPAVTFSFDVVEHWLAFAGIDRTIVSAKTKILRSASSETIPGMPSHAAKAFQTADAVDAHLTESTQWAFGILAAQLSLPTMHGSTTSRPTKVTSPLRFVDDFKNLHNLIGMTTGDGLRFLPGDRDRSQIAQYQHLVSILGQDCLRKFKLNRSDFEKLVDWVIDTPHMSIIPGLAKLLINRGNWQINKNDGKVSVNNLDNIDFNSGQDFERTDEGIVRILQKVLDTSKEDRQARARALLKSISPRSKFKRNQ